VHVHADLISLAAVILVALVCGLVFTRLRQPALVGYLLSGIVLGPSGFGLVAARDQVTFLAELGVLLLLFLVGMELSLRSFRAILGVALAAAGLQIVCATGIMWLFAAGLDWPLGVATLLGFAVALSSTAVAVKMLEDLNILRTQVGQLTVAILIAQDLAIVPMMLILGLFADTGGGWTDGLIKIGLSVVLLGLLVWYLSRRSKVDLPFSGALARSPELRPLYGLTLCFGAATVTGLLGLSAAYGAFLAGLMVGNSTARRSLMRGVQSVQSILIMVFFLSVGLLIDLTYVWNNIGTVLLILFIVTVVKSAFNIGILMLLREPWPHAFISGVMLAQVGEFSFLLGSVGLSAGLIDADGYQLVVTITAFTLIITPLWLATARRLLRIAVARAATMQEMIARLKEGGMRAMWATTRARPMPDVLAQRIFGRPRRRSVREMLEPNPAKELPEEIEILEPEAGAGPPKEKPKRAKKADKPAGEAPPTSD